MKYRVTHETQYHYDRPVSLCYNVAHLKPRSFVRQTCLASTLNVHPLPALTDEWEDYFGNATHYFAVQEPHDALRVSVISEVNVTAQGELFDSLTATPWEAARDALANATDHDAVAARALTLSSPFIPVNDTLRAYAEPSFAQGAPLLEAVTDLMRRIYEEFAYDPHFSTIATPLADVLEHRRGVCQDFAHLAIGCLRALGLAARYVSGYLETEPPPGGERLVGADASHAWFSVYAPDQGWVDFDPTNNQLPMEQHIVTAWGRDYGDVTPLKGVIFGGGEGHSLNVAVDVQRLD